MRTGVRVVAIFASAGVVATVGSCALDPDPRGLTSTSAPERCSQRQGGAHLDYLDSVRLNGVTYLAYPVRAGGTLDEKHLGPAYGTVRCTLSESVTDPEYEMRDGDAAYLDVGTTVYTVTGFSAQFRLAARRDGRIVVYEVETNPNARRPSDVLDIAGRVTGVSIHNSIDAGKVATIEDAPTVARLVDAVLGGTVDTSWRLPAEGDRYFVAFLLTDGTAVTRQFLVAADQLWPGIKTLPEFKAIILKAVGR